MKKKERKNSTNNSANDNDPNLSPILDMISDDLRTFEEKYVVQESVTLGEGCASTVKPCMVKQAGPEGRMTNSLKLNSDMLSAASNTKVTELTPNNADYSDNNQYSGNQYSAGNSKAGASAELNFIKLHNMKISNADEHGEADIAAAQS